MQGAEYGGGGLKNMNVFVQSLGIWVLHKFTDIFPVESNRKLTDWF